MPSLLDNAQVPPLYDVFMNMKYNIMKSLRCCLPGIVTVVDAVKGTIDVNVALEQMDPNGKAYPYPQLLGCYAVTLQGGGVGAKFPVAAGDECLVFFSDRCVDAWFKTGAPQPLPNLRMHDLSDGFALVGVNSLTNTFKTSLLVAEGGICESKSLTGAKVAIDPLTHKITVANQTTTLLILLDGLIDLVIGLTTTGGPTTQATSAATQALLTTYKTTIAGLLY